MLYRIGSIADSNAKLYTKCNLRWSNDAINILGFDLYRQDLDLNVDMVIDKLKAISRLWYNRQLTLMGKVLVINTLMKSLFAYKFQLLHHVNNSKFEKIDREIENFLWNGKRPKLPLNILRQPKDMGGLGLANLRLKHQALLLKWAKLGTTNRTVKKLAEYFLKVDNLELILRSNMNQTDSINYFGKSGFWAEFMRTWCHFNYHEPQSKDKALEQMVWWNSMICSNDIMLVNKKAIQAGLILVEHIWDEDSANWYPYDYICRKYDSCITWLDYRTLTEAIPKYWKFLLKTDECVDGTELIRDIIEKKTFTQLVYRKILTNNCALSASANKWVKLLQEIFDYDTHKMAFTNLYRITNITKLRNFQYRLLHNKIFCNNILYHWKIVTTQECDFCDEKQDIIHLLFKCEYANRLWKAIERYLQKSNIKTEITIENIQ